jgi:hypothetical protein
MSFGGAYARVRGFGGTILNRINLHGAYVRVFKSPDGELVLNHICKVGHIGECTFVKGDPHESALREGERRMALSILKFVNRDHESLVKQIEKGLEDAT